jgi:cathepsin A (carboxypeptidase C)
VDFALSTSVVPPEFCDPSSKSLSGYFGVTGSKYDRDRSKRYFYWFFERRSQSMLPGQQTEERNDDSSDDDDEEKIPFVIWLNGGPGCSSLLGLLQENGPCLINDDGQSTRLNPYSWTEEAHVLYLDQPAFAGYSYGDGYDDSEDETDSEMVAEDAYYFLQSFFRSDEGEKYRNLPLYLTGEVSSHLFWDVICVLVRGLQYLVNSHILCFSFVSVLCRSLHTSHCSPNLEGQPPPPI